MDEAARCLVHFFFSQYIRNGDYFPLANFPFYLNTADRKQPDRNTCQHFIFYINNSFTILQVQGIVQDRHGKTVATLFGKWDESMHYVIGDYSVKGKGSETLSESHLLWKQSRPPKFPTRYNLTRFAITLNELTPGLKVNFLMNSETLYSA